MSDDYSKLPTNEILLRATEASTLQEIEECLEIIVTRKRISDTKLLIPFYTNVLRLAAAARAKEPVTDISKPPPKPKHFPDTVVIPRDKAGNALNMDIIFNEYTALYLCRYQVGKRNGLSQNERRDLLTYFMNLPLHPKIIQIFGNEYDEPESMGRLMKIANIIASNCKLRKLRKDAANYEVAIDHYEEDLEFLRERFYIPMSRGEPHLPWPETEI